MIQEMRYSAAIWPKEVHCVVLPRLHVVACNGWVVRQAAGAPTHGPTNSIFLGRSELGNSPLVR